MSSVPTPERATRLSFFAAIEAVAGGRVACGSRSPVASPVLEGQARRSGATRARDAASRSRRMSRLVLAMLVLAASAVAPALSGEPIDDRFGVGGASARVDGSRGSILSHDLARAAGRSTWATHGDRSATSESSRMARRTGPTTPLRFASFGALTARPPRMRVISRLGGPDQRSVDALIHSLGSAPRGPPSA